MSNFNDSKVETYDEPTSATVSVVNTDHYAVKKVTITTQDGEEQSISGGESVQGSLNTDLTRATTNDPVTFAAQTTNDYYVHGQQIKYKVTPSVASGQSSFGDATVTPSNAQTAGITEVDGSATLNATVTPPCTFQGWSGSATGYMADPNSPQSGITGLDNGDVSAVANFNCITSILDQSGSVVSGTGNETWVEIQGNMHVPDNKLCNLFKYNPTNADISSAESGCTKTYLKVYDAHYEKVSDFDGYEYIYHARGWGRGTYVSPLCIYPQYGSYTSVNNRPVANEVMFFPEPGNLSKCALVTSIPSNIGTTDGYPSPSSTEDYYATSPSPGATYINDGSPDIDSFIANGFSWGDLVLGTSSSTTGRWFVSSPYVNYPRSTWLVISPMEGSGTYGLDSSRFDVTDTNGVPLIGNITDVNQLLNCNESQLDKSQVVWFELERKDVNVNTSVAGSDYFQTYFNDQVTYTGQYITKLNGDYITDSDPTYITVYDSIGQKYVYQKVVTERLYVRQVIGTLVGEGTETTIVNPSQPINYDYLDGECGTFDGWYSHDYQGNATLVGDGGPHIQISAPNSCCQTFKPKVLSCSDKYYPYGYYDGNVYYRYALLPYVDENGVWQTPPADSVIYPIGVNSIITNGLDGTNSGQGSDSVFFKLNALQTVYYNGLLLLDFVASGVQNEGNYRIINGRHIERITQSSLSESSFKEVDLLSNTGNTARFYRVAYLDLPVSLMDPNNSSESHVSTYDPYEDAFLSGELFLYIDTFLGIEYYKGIRVMQGLVYKNNCKLSKSAVILSCPQTDELSQKISMESWYIDYGVTNDVEYDTTSGVNRILYRNVKQYEPLVVNQSGQDVYDFSVHSGMVDWSMMGDGRPDDFCIIQRTMKYDNVYVSWPKHQRHYELNTFDAPHFGFTLSECVPVSTWLVFGYALGPNGWEWVHTGNTETSCGYPNTDDSAEVRNCYMLPLTNHKFIADWYEDKMVKLDASNISKYTNPNAATGGYEISGDCGEFSLFTCGIESTSSYGFAIDETNTYRLGHYAYGTDPNSWTYGLWWPMNCTEIISECSSLGLQTYSLTENGYAYDSHKKYILIEENDGQQIASYYNWSTNAWVQYSTFPLLIKCENMGTHDELVILRKIEDIGTNVITQPLYVIEQNGYHTAADGFKDVIRPITAAPPYNDPVTDLNQIIGSSNKKLCYVMNRITNGSGQYFCYVDNNLFSDHFWGGVDGEWSDPLGAYTLPKSIRNAEELLEALDAEVRFIMVAETFTYDGITYTAGQIYRLNVSVKTESSGIQNGFYTFANNFYTSEGYDAKTNGADVDFALDNGELYIPIKYDSASTVTITEFYCTQYGFDKNGYYVGIPSFDGTDYKVDCTTFSGTSNQGVFRKLACDCVSIPSEGHGFMPINNNTECAYSRPITYDSDFGYYVVSKQGFYIGDDFIEVPVQGKIKWLRLSDEGFSRKIINMLINGITSVRDDSNGYLRYRLTAPLSSTGGVLNRRYYDYVFFNGTPPTGSTIHNVSNINQLQQELASSTPAAYIKIGSIDIFQPISTGAYYFRKYRANEYYKLNYNYYANINVPVEYGTSITQNNPYTFDFLGWMVESEPSYVFYCDAYGNTNTGIVENPVLNAFTEVQDIGDNIFVTIGSVFPNPFYHYEQSTVLDNFTVVENTVDLDDCMFNVKPFKIQSYDGLALQGFDNHDYYDGEYYEPNVELLSTAIKYRIPYLYIMTSLDYNGRHYEGGQYFVNTGVKSVVYTENDAPRVFNSGDEYIMIADYRKLDAYPGDTVFVDNIDDLVQAIANQTEYIEIGLYDLHYRYLTYEAGEYYQFNRITYRGRIYNGGDVLKQKIDYRYFPVNESVDVLPCETAIALYSYHFEVDFCTIGNRCDPNIENGIFAMFYTYDGDLMTCSPMNSGDYRTFYIDHRHFTGRHNIGYSAVDGYDSNDIFNQNASDPACRRPIGFMLGNGCRKDFHGETIVIDPNEVNNIRTFYDGLLPSCNVALQPSGGCDGKIITNDTLALFGQSVEVQAATENQAYPYYDYLSYSQMGDNGLEAFYYEWNPNTQEYDEISDLGSGVNPNEIYHLSIRWRNIPNDYCNYALKRRVSVGLYKVRIQECPGINPTSINQNDILDFANPFTSSSINGIAHLDSFVPYLITGSSVDEFSGVVNNRFGLPFSVRPNTLYKATYTKIYDVNAKLSNTTDVLELFMLVYDVSTAPQTLFRQNYEPVTPYPAPQNVTQITTQEELEDAILSNVPLFIITAPTSFEYNGIIYNGGTLYGNSIYYGGPNVIIAGDCSNPFIKYITSNTAVLNPPIISNNGNTITINGNNAGVDNLEVHYTIDGTDPNQGSPTYSGAFVLDGSLSPVTIKAIATAGVGYSDSSISTKTVEYSLGTPSIDIRQE